MLEPAIRIAVGLGIAYAVLVVLAWRYQERLAFPAPRTHLPGPAAAGMPDGRRVTVTTSDSVTLHGWYLPPVPPPPAGSRSPGLLWFYGNMETVAALGPLLRDFRPPGIAMLVLDYRGYGESGGEPTEPGLYRDADAAWDYLATQPDVDATRIAVYGRSLGGAVAMYLADTHPVRAVVLDSPFSSARDMARTHYAFLPSGLVRLSMDNVERARRLTVPLLVFQGAADALALPRMARAVAEAGRAQEYVLIQDAGHNDTYDFGGQPYRQKFHAFLESTLSP